MVTEKNSSEGKDNEKGANEEKYESTNTADTSRWNHLKLDILQKNRFTEKPADMGDKGVVLCTTLEDGREYRYFIPASRLERKEFEKAAKKMYMDALKKQTNDIDFEFRALAVSRGIGGLSARMAATPLSDE